MQRLSLLPQDGGQIMAMINTFSTEVVNRQAPTAERDTITDFGREPLEVNVIYTEPKATSAALNVAESLAGGLGAAIRLRAAIGVPHRLGLDQSPVSIPFMEQLLSGFVDERRECEYTVHLYLCRDAMGTLLQEIRPKSIVVIGGSRRWWPTAASRMARAFRVKGHRVVFVDANKVSS
jgi:hypothetical protein